MENSVCCISSMNILKCTLRIIVFMVITGPAISAGDPVERPGSLDNFVNGAEINDLSSAIAGASQNSPTHIYLPAAKYVLNNPVVIDRDTPLFLFGVGSGHQGTRLIAKDPSKPIFEIRRVPRLSMYGVGIDQAYPSRGGVAGVQAFRFVNTQHVYFDLQDSDILRSYIRIKGPVTTTMQQVAISDQKDMPEFNSAGLVIDHPLAETYLVGFGGTYHDYLIDQKKGHLEVYGLASALHSKSDIRIESPSTKAAHIIAGGRSEANRQHGPGRLLLVPSTNKKVNVVVKGTSLTGSKTDQRAMISYNARGTLWMLSNSGGFGVNALVDRYTSDATVVAIGNSIRGNVDPDKLFSVTETNTGSVKIYDYCNMFDVWKSTYVDNEYPRIRLGNSSSCATDNAELPEVPIVNNGIVKKLGRPAINSVPPGLLTSVETYGAYPNDGIDDTLAIQDALNEEGPFLYFPEGTYNTSAPLTLTDRTGGLIAGAGQNKTRIISSSESVVNTDGMARVTWQGLAMEVENKHADSGSVFSMAFKKLENESEPQGNAPTGNSFYNVAFDGGHYGISMGNDNSPHSCSETMIVDSVFRNSYMGLATGSRNALNQWLNDVSFLNNNYNLGASDVGITNGGGSWYVFKAFASGTINAGTRNINNTNSNIYYNKYYSRSPSLFTSSGTVAPKHVLIDNSTLNADVVSVNDPYLTWRTSGGVMFLHSRLKNGYSGSILQQYDRYKSAYDFVVSLHSYIQDWDLVATDALSSKLQIP